MKHTPGPWTHTLFSNEIKRGSRVVARTSTDYKDACTKANACLIAAAPEMLAALERAREVAGATLGQEVWAPFFKQLDEAIAKARGQR